MQTRILRLYFLISVQCCWRRLMQRCKWKNNQTVVIKNATNPFLAATRTPCIPRLKPKWPRLKCLTTWVTYRAKHISETKTLDKLFFSILFDIFVQAWNDELLQISELGVSELLAIGNYYGVLGNNHWWNNGKKVDVSNTTLCLLPIRWIAPFSTASSK